MEFRTGANSLFKRQLSRGRLILFSGLAMCLMALLVETGCGLLWWFWQPHFTWSSVEESISSLKFDGRDGRIPSEAIHPYLGWVLNPDVHTSASGRPPHQVANRFGFVDDGETIYQKRPDRVLIGVCGGSVAQQASWFGEDVIRQRLQEAPQYAGKELRFVRLAMSGYKQPQQLMALNYLLTLGGELDLLINIDGYNEFALTLAENKGARVSLAYPRMWHARLQDVVDPRATTTSFRLLELKAKRMHLAEEFERTLLRSTRTGVLVWMVRDHFLKERQVKLGIEVMSNIHNQGHGFAEDGPRDNFETEEQADQRAIEIWRNSSLQLSRLCNANGIRYIHALQPNQYHEGSKPLSDYERKERFDTRQSLGMAIKRLYPKAIVVGNELRSQGVHFVDLTRLFADVHETIYSDYFCHYTREGSRLLAAAVSEELCKPTSTTAP